MKIQYLSDLHLEFGAMELPITDADVVILAGDVHLDGQRAIDWAGGFPQDVIYVLGNHEFYGCNSISESISKTKAYAAQYPKLHVLSNDSVVLNGVTFHGCTLWTDFELDGSPEVSFYYAKNSISDFKRIHFDHALIFTPALSAELHSESVQWLQSAITSSKTAKNIVVTHHLPTPNAIHSRYSGSCLNPAFASDCSWLFSSKITTWIYGHNHDCNYFEQKGIQFRTNQRGYIGHEFIPGFDAYRTFEI
ncbi:metallophosphoesterase [Vibrio superstes]|uniref:Phosphatase n=1 Tax=Vibrio superstes NBRC 103154 TaxID=1219062 RepID=A0A511QN36_9VIBR|nr:metallophosphoesterase [Vibrio superstes]GEM78744.1 phosphatase [Vibrio superstes NBRC 103154]